MNNPAEDSIRIARAHMDSLQVESRLLGAEEPSSAFEFLGVKEQPCQKSKSSCCSRIFLYAPWFAIYCLIPAAFAYSLTVFA